MKTYTTVNGKETVIPCIYNVTIKETGQTIQTYWHEHLVSIIKSLKNKDLNYIVKVTRTPENILV